MSKLLAVVVSGLVFGLGLAVSQMVNPAKVLGFLDIAGNWDPSLAFVMGGAVIVAFVAFRVTYGRGHPIFEPSFASAGIGAIDGRLVGGSIVFGIGWGLVGFCPGPAVTSLAYGMWESLIFVAAMLVGAVIYNFVPGAASPKGTVATEA